MIGNERKDPDIRDLSEEQRPAAADAPPAVTRMEAPKPATYATVRNGSFNDGWTELIRLLDDTLTDEQKALLSRGFERLKKGGANVR